MVHDYYGSGDSASNDILPNSDALRREKRRDQEKYVAQVIVSFILMAGAFASLLIGNWLAAGLFFLCVGILSAK